MPADQLSKTRDMNSEQKFPNTDLIEVITPESTDGLWLSGLPHEPRLKVILSKRQA